MKKTSFLLVILGSLYIAAAQDAAALYKSKCVSCHGANGAGKPAIKGSNLLTEDAKKKTDEALTDAILNGGAAKKAAHAYGKKGVNADQAKALTAHIRGLQK